MKSSPEKTHQTMAEHYLDIACQNIPVVGRTIRQYGDLPLHEYLQRFIPKTISPSYQPRDDFLEVVYQYAAPLLGESLAKRAVHDLEISPAILTSNHLGIEYFAQSLQSSILFSLNAITGDSPVSTVPVFSCGNVPLDNLTYPQGLLLYHVCFDKSEAFPKKLPVFPNRLRRKLVSVAPSFDQAMVHKAVTQLDKMIRHQQISHKLAGPIRQILWDDYCSDSVMTLPNYSEQAIVLNNRIWKQLFPEISTRPDMVCLELEKLTAMLLEYDLSDVKSLAWRVMFDSSLRENVLENLDSVKGCWEQKKIALRMASRNKSEKKSAKNCGTVFFWGIDDSGKRISLRVETDGLKNEVLQGVDDYGKIWEVPCTPQTIICGLQEQRLIPSLFTCFLTLSFARGLICVGGYFQGEYLSLMQQGLVVALQKKAEHLNIAHFVGSVPTSAYLSGMLPIMAEINDDSLIQRQLTTDGYQLLRKKVAVL